MGGSANVFFSKLSDFLRDKAGLAGQIGKFFPFDYYAHFKEPQNVDKLVRQADDADKKADDAAQLDDGDAAVNSAPAPTRSSRRVCKQRKAPPAPIVLILAATDTLGLAEMCKQTENRCARKTYSSWGQRH
jgi:hypothetical protein